MDKQVLMYTQQPIRNYVAKGEKVKVISQSGEGVCLIEYKGERYPCRIELLSEKPPSSTVETNTNDFQLL